MQLLDSLKKKAKAMGNTVGSNRKGAKQVVTVLQADGRVLEFPRPIRVSDLLYDHPNHFVCHSSALVLMQQGKMLPHNTLLNRGHVYFLLPLPSASPAVVESAPLLLSEGIKPAKTMKFVISKQQLAKILAEGNIKVVTKDPEPASHKQVIYSQRSSHIRVLHHPAPTLVKRPGTWTPGLDSISEVPVM
ncbi:hypothetical protein Mapa_001831 [Marchantia paleacea]|nr:hypothetical protein Mapa_001831 [Marchantia paleacea]